MTTTRTYEQIYADITDATTDLAKASVANVATKDRQAFVEPCERLAALWGEASWLADRDRLPSTAVLSARLLADRYADDARAYSR